MFTGIIEDTGEIREIRILPQGGARLTMAVPFAAELKPGESVAVNGCCLTVTQVKGDEVSVDLLQQTLNVTNLGRLASGSVVNLERALLPADRLGGHIVQGHIDETAEIIGTSMDGQDTKILIALSSTAKDLVIERGSIAVDGISLTVAELSLNSFTVWIIPHTLEVTNLKTKQPGELVNLEFDLLGKYVQRQLSLRFQMTNDGSQQS